MIPTLRRCLTFLFLAALVPLLGTGPVQAQSGRRQSRLAQLQQQNAVQQQQNAVQTAVLQTTVLLQATSLQAGAPNTINFQQQQTALQVALQQTTALLQTSIGQSSAISETALRQMNVLQTALQQTMSVQGALSVQGGQLTVFQRQTLNQEQSNLMGLLTSQPPPAPRMMSYK